MFHVSRWVGRLGLLLCTVAAISLASCDSTSSTAGQAAVSTATLAPTATRGPTATPTPQGLLCEGDLSSRLVATSGDLQFTALTTMSMDPPRQLPDDLLLRPYPNPSNLAALHEVNTHLYSIVVCNMSKTKAHVLQDVKVKLESFVADTNTINTTHNCIRLYSRQGMIDHTGCGGGFAGGDLNLSASFASNGTIGAVASTQGMTPMTLAPGYGAYITVDVTPPSTPGTATYRLGFAFDNAGSIYPVAASAPVTNSDKMRMWDGDACLPDAMQSQVPTTNPSTPYICPQAS